MQVTACISFSIATSTEGPQQGGVAEAKSHTRNNTVSLIFR